VEVKMTNGKSFIIDDHRADLMVRGWYIHTSGYVVREKFSDCRRTLLFLHHEVLGTRPERGVHLDHRNGNKLDNRYENLRLATVSQNLQNRPIRTKRGTYRGVTWKADQGPNGKWCARAMINYKAYHIGYFEDEEEAARAVIAWRAEHMTHSDADRGSPDGLW
jgi:hypothetical protein